MSTVTAITSNSLIFLSFYLIFIRVQCSPSWTKGPDPCRTQTPASAVIAQQPRDQDDISEAGDLTEKNESSTRRLIVRNCRSTVGARKTQRVWMGGGNKTKEIRKHSSH